MSEQPPDAIEAHASGAGQSYQTEKGRFAKTSQYVAIGITAGYFIYLLSCLAAFIFIPSTQAVRREDFQGFFNTTFPALTALISATSGYFLSKDNRPN